MLSGLYLPHIGQNTAFSNSGRHIPWALAFVNAAFDLPMRTTRGNDMSLGADYIGAALTIGMAVLGVRLLTATLAHDDQPVAGPRDTATAAA